MKQFRRLNNRITRDFFRIISDSPVTRNLDGNQIIKYLNVLFSKSKFMRILQNPHFKKFADSKFSVDPLADKLHRETSLTILIPCTSKDFSILPSVIDAARINVRNPISEIVVVTPDTGLDLKNIGDVRVLHDDFFLKTTVIQDTLIKLGLNSGWIKQQLIKILFCLTWDATNVLILDADTVLTKPRYFVSEEVQILSFAYEYHAPYMKHLSGFCSEIHDFGLTFVTHHQLWQKDIVQEIWGKTRLLEWLSTFDRQELSPISEYHTYGLFAYNFHPSRVIISRFGNEQFSRKILVEKDLEIQDVMKTFPDSCSVSLHSYS